MEDWEESIKYKMRRKEEQDKTRTQKGNKSSRENNSKSRRNRLHVDRQTKSENSKYTPKNVVLHKEKKKGAGLISGRTPFLNETN